MDYRKHYNKLIIRAKCRSRGDSYYENHHVIPRCMGGTDDKDNIVLLTPEEHYLAHQLLTKIHPDNHKLVYAANMMAVSRTTNKIYGWIRRHHREVISKDQLGEGNSQYGTKWITNGENNVKIRPPEDVPNGWILGRTLRKRNITPRKRNIIPRLHKVRLCEKCRRERDLLEKQRINESKFRRSFEYRLSKSEELYEEFISLDISLREFAKIKKMTAMTLSNWFRECIPEYDVKPRIRANKQIKNDSHE